MFCPNCGTQNPDAAQTCSKCNFHLKSVAAPKFKGTMLMMNQPGVVPVGPPQQQPNTQRTGGGMSGSTPPPPGAAGPAPQAPNRLKGTMVGVAPMAGGGPMGGPPRGMNAPVAVPQPGGYPMQPGMQPGGMHGAPPGMQGMPPGMGQQPPRTPPPPGMPETGSAYSPPVPQPGVNPLGGTVAADGSAFNQAFGGPPPGQGGMNYGGQPPQGTAMMPGMGAPYGQSPYGAPPQGPGAPPYDPSAYGAPPPNPFAGPPPGYNPGPSGSSPPMGTPPPQAMMPYGAAPTGGSGPSAAIVPANASPGGLLYGVVPGSTSGPVKRSPGMTLVIFFGLYVGGMIANILARIVPPLSIVGSLLSLAASVYLILILFTMAIEVKAASRNASFKIWQLIIPIYGTWILLPREVTKAKQVLGVQRATRGILAYIFIPSYALAADVNDLVR